MVEPISIRAHFDGRSFVPDEPVSVPLGTSVVVVIDAPEEDPATAARLAALDRFLGSVEPPPGFDARKISREDLYD